MEEAARSARQPVEYDPARFASAAEWIRGLARDGSTLVDIGCGSGNVLGYLRAETGIDRLAGIDVSRGGLRRARERTGCEVHEGSILDERLVASLAGRFDFAVLGAVLHHVVGRTRRDSRRRARLALAHAVSLVRPGGHVVVHEPVFQPRWAMSLVFHVKRAAATLTSRRLELLDPWNNLGAPVVSYYTLEELRRMIADEGRAELVDERSVPAYLPALQRAAFIRRREDASLLVRRRQAACASSS